MSAISKKCIVISILAGIVFFLGGVGVAWAIHIDGVTPDDPIVADVVATDAEIAAARAAVPAALAAARAAAAAEAANSAGISAGADAMLKAASCKWSWLCVDLIPLFISYVIFIASAGILMLAGYLFDSILFLGINRDFIDQLFVKEMWGIVRDFSNMAFIFILLYTGIQTMLGQGDWKRTVTRVVIIALLINFSLFFTKVVIDAGNVLAVGIYSSMGVVSADPHVNFGNTRERSISRVLVDAVSPEKFLGGTNKTKSTFVISVIFIIGAITNLLIAFALFRVAIIFIGRIIGFWFLMIISPFAFISTTIPKLEKNFHDWLNNLLGLAFVAPVFLFFLYLILKVLNSPIVSNLEVAPTDNTFTFALFFMPVLMVIMIYFALDKSVTYAKSMAGSFGELGAKLVGGAMGLAAGGVAIGAVGLTRGLSKIGGLGKNADGTDKAGRWAAAARGAGMAGHAGRNQTFDARNISGKWVGIKGTLGEGLKASGADAGAGRTKTLNTIKAEKVKEAEEKEDRKAERPESVAKAVEEALKKRQVKRDKLKERIEAIEKAVDGELVKAVNEFALVRGMNALTLGTAINTAKAAQVLAQAEMTAALQVGGAAGAAAAATAQTAYATALTQEQNSQKDLKTLTEGEKKIRDKEEELEKAKKALKDLGGDKK